MFQEPRDASWWTLVSLTTILVAGILLAIALALNLVDVRRLTADHCEVIAGVVSDQGNGIAVRDLAMRAYLAVCR